MENNPLIEILSGEMSPDKTVKILMESLNAFRGYVSGSDYFYTERLIEDSSKGRAPNLTEGSKTYFGVSSVAFSPFWEYYWEKLCHQENLIDTKRGEGEFQIYQRTIQSIFRYDGADDTFKWREVSRGMNFIEYLPKERIIWAKVNKSFPRKIKVRGWRTVDSEGIFVPLELKVRNSYTSYRLGNKSDLVNIWNLVNFTESLIRKTKL